MTDESIATLYRKACPSCARQYARDAHACPFCGYREGSGLEAQEDQDRLYEEYLRARIEQAEAELAASERQAHASDTRSQVMARAELDVLRRELTRYEMPASEAPASEAHAPAAARAATETGTPKETRARPDTGGQRQETRAPKAPERAAGDKTCPVCSATVPKTIARCACGHVFGQAPVTPAVCPHCTAPIAPGQERCGCGYPVASQLSESRIPGLSKRP